MDRSIKEEPDVGEEELDKHLALPNTLLYERSQLPDLLRVYYTWIFPYDKYFDWLQYGGLSGSYCCMCWLSGSLVTND